MLKVEQLLEYRTVSGFNVSIGTGMALETLFSPLVEVYDKERKVDKVDIKKYKYHFFNIYLLIRNIFTSFPTEIKNKILTYPDRSKLISEILFKEIEVLDEVYSNVDTEVILWIPDYKAIYHNVEKKSYSGSISKKDEIFLFVSSVITFVNKELENKTLPISVYKNKHLLPKIDEPFLITSHMGVDLLNVKKSPKMELLESHTGKVIDRRFFNKKYHAIGKLDLSMFPMTESLMYILGDNMLIKPYSLGVRREIHKLSIEKRWHPLISDMKVRNDLRGLSSLRDALNVNAVDRFKYIY
jgi:hypothetical protein